MISSFLRTLLLALSLLPAQAFVQYVNPNGQVLRWNLTTPTAHTNVVNPGTKAIRFFVGSDAYSQANRTAEIAAVRACFAQWQSVPGTILKFEDAGFAGPGIEMNTQDHTNAVFWTRTLFVNGGRDNISGLQGYTLIRLSAANEILEGDIVLNGVQNEWNTDFYNRTTVAPFIEGVLLHEIGHLIGLDHSPLGGATVITGSPGVGTEAGLSSDEIAAVHYLYPADGIPATLGHLRGRVTLNGSGILGAIVTADDSHGNALAATVTRADGRYELGALPPGRIGLRASPFNPATIEGNFPLLAGMDIAATGDYDAAVTGFLATPNRSIALAPGVTNVADIAVTAGDIGHITAISPAQPTELAGANRFPTRLVQGQSNYFVGVSGSTLPTNGILKVTGDGLSLGPTLVKPFTAGRTLYLLSISVSSNAAPGLRSFVIQTGTNQIYANGYLEITPAILDSNFDGLDDNFQRRYFLPFTELQAGPTADPDGDGYNNQHEYLTGTNPVDPAAFQFKIQTVKMTPTGTQVTFESGPGRRYQIYRRATIEGSPWETVGAPVLATSTSTTVLDGIAKSEIRFYRVQVLP